MEVNCNMKYIVCIPTTIRQWSERKEQHEAKTQIKNEAKNSSAHREREGNHRYSSPLLLPWPGLVEQLISITLPCYVGIRNGNGTHTLLGKRIYFPTEKSHPKARWFYCAAAEWNQNRQQQEQTRSNWLLSTWWCWWWWMGGTEWGGLVACLVGSACRCALENRGSVFHPAPGCCCCCWCFCEILLLAPAAFRRDAELSQLVRTRWGLSLWTSTSTTIPTTHLKLCAGMRHGTSWQTQQSRTELNHKRNNNIICTRCSACAS